MLSRQRTILAYVAIAFAVLIDGATVVHAQKAPAPKRARPPKWPAAVKDVFFENANEQLVGERPDYGTEAVAASDPRQSRGLSAVEGGSQKVDEPKWSVLIDADAIETEIKRLAVAVAAGVTTPGAFKGGAYKSCRENFSLLAVLFAVAGEYDGPVRWQDIAPALRDEFAKAVRNSRVATDATYQEAVQKKQELADLVSGSRPQVPEAERVVGDWSEVADRAPLMQRLKLAHEERMMRWVANEKEFETHAQDTRHEAQMMAMLANVIAREGFDYWDDETFAGYARELQQAATEMAAAADARDFKHAQQAAGRATKACADCHDGYRG